MQFNLPLLAILAIGLVDAKRRGDPRPVKIVDYCQKYKEDGTVFWSHGGDLQQKVNVGDNFQMTDSLNIKLWINSGINPRGPYWYDFTAFAPTVKGGMLWLESKRSWGQGEGHQFLITFLDKSDPPKEMDAYWLGVNERCNTTSTHDASEYGGVRVRPRWYV